MRLSPEIRALLNSPRLNKQEERDFLRLWQEKKDYKARERVIRSFMPLVVRIAYRITGGDDRLSDAISEGILGLMRATDGYSLDGPTQFSTWAIVWSRAEISKFVIGNRSHLSARFQGEVSRRIYFNLERAKVKLGIERDDLTHGDVEALATALQCKPKDITDTVNALHSRVSLDTQSSDSRESFIASIPADGQSPFEIVAESEISAHRATLLRRALSTVSPKSREMFERYYLGTAEENHKEIAKSLNISHQAVSQNCQKVLDKVTKLVRAAA